MRKIVSIIIMLLMILSCNISYAAEPAVELNYWYGQHNESSIKNKLYSYGYTGEFSLEDKLIQTKEWDMETTIEIVTKQTTVGSTTYYTGIINSSNIGEETTGQSYSIEDVYEKVRKKLKDQGYVYEGKLEPGINVLKWKAKAYIEAKQKQDLQGNGLNLYTYYMSITGTRVSETFNPEVEVENEITTGQLTKIQEYYEPNTGARTVTRYIKDEGTPVYNYSESEGMKWGGNTLNKGYEVNVKAKYKDENGKEWALLSTGMYVEANNLQVDAPAGANGDGNNNGSGDGNGGGGSSGFGSSGVLMGAVTGTNMIDPTQNPDAYKPDDITTSDMGDLMTKAGKIIGVIRNIGVVVGVIGLSALGLRYMFASLEEKAEYKQTMMPFVLGCVLLMAGTVVIDFIYSVATKF